MTDETGNTGEPASVDDLAPGPRTILITGVGGGIGRATALKFARSGANLVLGDIAQTNLEETARLAGAAGASVAVCVGDVTREGDVAELVAAALAHFGRLDVAINNAGIVHPPVRIAEMDLEAFQRIVTANLTGTFLCMRAELAVMRRQKAGVIVNVASLAGLVGAPMLGAYAAAKHAVVGLTKTAAAEGACDDIRINAICPSFADTDMVGEIARTMRGSREEAVERLVAGVPLGRLARCEEIADAIAWLADPANSFMTGQAVALDGGASAL